MSVPVSFPTTRADIAGLSVSDLVAEFGTPLYVYDLAKIAQRIEDLRAFDVIRFAQKACSNLGILDFVRQRGVVVDAVSAGEVRRAFAAGFDANGDPPPVVYCADIFDHEALDLVVEHDIHVNCGSPDMIHQLGQRAPGRGITLRINPGFGHGHSQKTNTGGEQSKHGIWHVQLEECLRQAEQQGLQVSGLHMHIGSGSDFEHLAQVCEAMRDCARQVGRSLTSISAGGGLPVPYREGEGYVDIDRYFELWDGMRRELSEEFGHRVKLEIEPGRFLAAEAGFLIAEIRAIKQMGDNLFYVVDAGFTDLARPVMYGAYHPISVTHRVGSGDRPLRPVVVGGPLCESGDIFTQEPGGFVCSRDLPEAAIGDWLILECAGAYGFVMASNYNSRPMPAEVAVRDGAAHLIRKRQSFDDLVRGELIPQ